MKSFYSRKYLVVWLALSMFQLAVFGTTNPGEKWMQYATPEEAGWSSEKLEEAKQYAKQIGSSAGMIIYDGKVVADWGETTRRFMCHSVRKSFLSALYGIHVQEGTIDLNKTLAELGTDDIYPLTAAEKEAKISDLLKARSGVYHPAAYETDAMKKARPKRGSHAANTFWYYNNWDFNTLCGILQDHTKSDFFEDFQARIASQIGMEDFRLEDCYYHLEAEQSKYPAYPFRMSARDMARFGQLFLQNGKWDQKQLISQTWVAESTMSYSANTRTEGRGYAYLWWTGIYGQKHANYSAQGVGNQAIIVYPDENIVIVNRANTFKRERVKTSDLVKLTEMIFEARNGAARTQPSTKVYQPNPVQVQQTSLDANNLKKFAKTYKMGKDKVTVSVREGRLLADTPYSGKFYLLPQSNSAFLLEDAHYKIYFDVNKKGVPKKKIRLER